MKRISKFLFSAMLAVAAGAALAQPQGGPPPPGGHGRGGPGRGPNSSEMILRMTSVQKELRLSADQIRQIEEMRPPPPGRPPQGGPPPGDMPPPPGHDGPPPLDSPRHDPFKSILKPEQLGRLKQLALQFDAPMTMLDPRNGKELKLTQNQREEIDAIIREKLPRPERGAERPSWSDQQTRKSAATKAVMAILTATQKETWSQLTGTPFTAWEELRRRINH